MAVSVRRPRSPSSPKRMGNADALGYRWANESLFWLVQQEQAESDQADWPTREVVCQDRWPNGALNVWIDLVDSDGRMIKEEKTKKEAEVTPVDVEATLRRMRMMAERDAVRTRTSRFRQVGTARPTPAAARPTLGRRAPATISTEEAASRAARERRSKERAEAARALLANQRAQAAATFFATLAEFQEWNRRYRALKPVKKKTASDEDTWSDDDANDMLALYFAEKITANGDAVDGPATERAAPTTEELQQMRTNSDYLLALTSDMFEQHYDDRI